MGSSKGKQPESSDTSTAGSRTTEGGKRTPNNGRALSKHPGSSVIGRLSPPTPRWNDGSTNSSITFPHGTGTCTTTAHTSRRNSLNSARSGGSLSQLEDIKHEVMVNHLFQQQCGKMWIGEVTGEIEGIVIRKSRGTYLACPPALTHSPLVYYCSMLNIQVT
jgi:hypothetical protein